MGYKDFVSRYVHKKLGGYRHTINTIDKKLPYHSQNHVSVAIIGGGLAGITAAYYLSKRGISVTIYEKNSSIGGKVGSFRIDGPNNQSLAVDHGFHAFFYHYYNLWDLINELNISHHFQPIHDYCILTKNQRSFHFKGLETTPILNILDLGNKGFFKWIDILFHPKMVRMIEFFKYNPEMTFIKYDNMSFDDFANQIDLPLDLRLVFNTFSRAFFSDSDKISAAEVIKSFHFFYLSHNKGILYDYLKLPYDIGFIQPIETALLAQSVQLNVDSEINPNDICLLDNSYWQIKDSKYNYLIFAMPGHVTASFLSHLFSETSEFQSISAPSQGYAVYKCWLNQTVDSTQFPPFIITEKNDVLDAVTFLDQFDSEAILWKEKYGGSILELHCYALPETISSEANIKFSFIQELKHYFPQFNERYIQYDYLQWNRDFTFFGKGLYQNRPETTTNLQNLFLAGDWVKLPTPAQLMEGACTSGKVASNHILTQCGLQNDPVFSVPLRGLWS